MYEVELIVDYLGTMEAEYAGFRIVSTDGITTTLRATCEFMVETERGMYAHVAGELYGIFAFWCCNQRYQHVSAVVWGEFDLTEELEPIHEDWESFDGEVDLEPEIARNVRAIAQTMRRTRKTKSRRKK